jgi:Fe/S biogenesis protein NfuA
MRRKILKLLEEQVNPYVADHGGRIDLIDFLDGNVFLELSGGCQGCAASNTTLKQGVERLLREEFGDKIHDIIDVTDHASGANPYYAEPR